MLRKIRMTAAVLFLAGITLLLLDLTGSLHAWLGWMARVQLLPAILALNAAVVAALILLTLLFGRIYCSVVCPLGVMQDAISWTAGKRRRYRFAHSPAKTVLRGIALALFLAALVGGVGSVATFVAPYSPYGRLVTHIFATVWQLGNNLL
ncbi:MAG: 4Fe-4S binding protein, partial [Alistipes sp.]|nr:4Fe-4S binding protein [Alistipes sp.]